MDIIPNTEIPKSKIVNTCPFCKKDYWMDKSSLYRPNRKHKPCCSNSCSKKLATQITGHGPLLGKNWKIKKEDEDNFVSLYLGGLSAPKISKKTGFSIQSIMKVLYRNGVKIRNVSECRRKYKFNQNFFKELNGERPVYWLGFISADGNLFKTNEKQKDIKISLAGKDTEHLRKLNDDLSGDFKITIFSRIINEKSHSYSKIEIRSAQMYDDLLRFGLYPNKSLDLKPVDTEHLTRQEDIRHYWRGFVDGDGWVFFGDRTVKIKNKTYFGKNISTGLCGSYDIISTFQLFVRNITGVSYKIRKNGNIFAIHIGGKNCIKLLDYLYKDSTIFLDRKYETYKNIKEYQQINKNYEY